MKMTYNDERHVHMLDGRWCKSVTTVAKIPVDSYTLEQWGKRMVALGMLYDRNLIEKLAVDPENKDRGNRIAAEAINAARAHLPADRGTQMHKVLEMVLLNRAEGLLTDQQRRDSQVLQRTLDRYKLTPYDGLCEQFVAWPDQLVCGRFDAVMERADGRLILVDLKSGPNAVLYPHSVSVQLALYARAPFVSAIIEDQGDRCTVEDWREMPQALDRRYGYVLLVRPDDEIGTLHEIDIEHGWAGARHALEILRWRAAKNKGKDLVREVLNDDPPTAVYTMADLAETAADLDELRHLWKEAHRLGRFDAAFAAAVDRRRAELSVAS